MNEFKTLEQIKDDVAISRGYKNWVDHYVRNECECLWPAVIPVFRKEVERQLLYELKSVHVDCPIISDMISIIEYGV